MSISLRKFSGVSLSIGLLAAIFAWSTGLAPSAHSQPLCLTEVCFWEGADFQGERSWFHNIEGRTDCRQLLIGSQSVVNRYQAHILLFYSSDCAGQPAGLDPGHMYSNTPFKIHSFKPMGLL
ncbi:peptidase inhibitor family I36 protein [Nocardia altamirensis]|uniref:peptidase inhibitor family I36 protein n=1 Tax=Nocardia altamirensis TaxID=472158 RepID=UPI00114D3A07